MMELPWPAKDANKYTRGKLVIIAGSERYTGAAALAAIASQRMGAGYTEVVTAPGAVDVVRAASPSLVVRPNDGWEAGELPVAAEGKPCAVCIGPGFAADDEASADLVARVLKKAACPVLVDGGGLARLASKKTLRALMERADSGHVTVITPHGGEAWRLAKSLGLPNSDPERFTSALALATRSVAVLKGPDTYISDGKKILVMTEGTPALSKAGTGDVLAGMLAALLAQGADPLDAAMLATTLHARAGVQAAELFTEISVTAEDVAAAIPRAIASMAAGDRR